MTLGWNHNTSYFAHMFHSIFEQNQVHLSIVIIIFSQCIIDM